MTTRFSRREIIQQALIAAGFTALASNAALMSAEVHASERVQSAPIGMFTPEQIAWLDEVAETILPATRTPGAKAAAVGAFIALMVTDVYSPEESKAFMDGMVKLEAECVQTFARGFMAANTEQRHDLLVRLDKEAHEHSAQAAEDDPPHYFRRIKELTVFGFFSSEIGYTQALRYVETPGRWDPCVDYKPGERAWARHA